MSYRQAPRWFPLYCALLAVATLTPLWRTCTTQPFSSDLNPLDFAQNVLLFIPFGLALRGLPKGQLALLALGASIGIELLQTRLPRHPGWFDLIANLAGALTGRSLPTRWVTKVWPKPGRAAWVGAASLLLAFTALAGLRRVPNDFSNWEDYGLVIGNEITGDRPWLGEIEELALFDRAISDEPEPIGALEPPSWRDGGPILWLRFEPPIQARVDGPDGPRPLAIPNPPPAGLALGENLSVSGGGWVLPRWAARAVGDRLTATGQLTVTARVRAAQRDAVGPSRIVSFSRDTALRNFTLGQLDANLVLRVRTPNTNDNASGITAHTDRGPLTMQLQNVRAAFHGPYGRIFVDGVCEGEQLYALAYGAWPLGIGIAVTILVCCVMTALAAASLVSRGPRERLAAFLLCGGAAWSILWAAGCWAHFPAYDGIAAAVGVTGLAAASPLLRNIGAKR